MIATETDICNLSLGHLGVAHQVADIETEKSAEARACKLYFAMARDMVLRDFDWGFATKTVELALVETLDPQDGAEFAFSYRYPASAVKVRRILSGSRVDTLQSARPYRLSEDGAGKLILVDAGPGTYFAADAVFAEVTANDVAVEFYPSDFVMALSYFLASLIAPRIVSGKGWEIGEAMLKRYYLYMSQSAKNDAHESSPDLAYDSEFIRIRT